MEEERTRHLIFADAVTAFWTGRSLNQERQARRGRSDAGTRGSVTGGGHLDAFALKLRDMMVEARVPNDSIFIKQGRTLPGFFRATKEWDLVVVHEGNLLAALELKSMVGSVSNNLNNRSEEAIGSAFDFWQAYREGAFQTSPTPWLGFIYVLEDLPTSHNAVRHIQEPHVKVFEEFRGASYVERVVLLCRRLVRERQYTSACFILADRQRAYESENYTEPTPDLTADLFVAQLLRHMGTPGDLPLSSSRE